MWWCSIDQEVCLGANAHSRRASVDGTVDWRILVVVATQVLQPPLESAETPHAGGCLNGTARTRGLSIAGRKGLCRPSSRTWLQCSG